MILMGNNMGIFTTRKTRIANEAHVEAVSDVKKYFEQLVVNIKQTNQNNNFLTKFVNDSNCYLYVSRLNDHKIVWISEYVREKYGNVIGQVCHEVFQDLVEPCIGCVVKQEKAEEGKEYTRVYHNKTTNQVFYIIDVMYFIEGEQYRFEKALDITNHIDTVAKYAKMVKDGNKRHIN